MNDFMVYVVDDDESVRDSIARLMGSEGWPVRAFADARSFLECKRGDTACCIVLDIGLPDLNGLELQVRLLEQEACPPIVFLTGRGDIPMSVRAMKAGAVEFLTKPFLPDELLGAVRGGVERDRERRRRFQDLALLRSRYAALTTREREVMAGVVEGLLNKQIAANFGTKETTVKEQRARLMAKMEVGSAAELVRLATRLGLVSQDGS